MLQHVSILHSFLRLKNIQYCLLFIHQLVEIGVSPFGGGYDKYCCCEYLCAGFYFMWTSVFISSALIPRNRITGSYGSSVFHFFRTYQAIFHGRCMI